MAGFKQGGIEFKGKSVIGNPTTADHIIVYWNNINDLIIKSSTGEEVIATESLLAALSGNLQAQIDNLDTGYVTESELQSLSAYFETQVNNNTTLIYTVSAGLQLQIDNLDLEYATDTMVASLTSNLQTQINDNTTLILDVSGNLQFQIDNLSGDFLGLTDTPLTYSGSDTYVLTVSGNGVVFTPQSEIIPVLTYPSLSGALDPHYVNVTGDTMTGDLTVNSNTFLNGNITISGDIIQISGSNTTQIAETLIVEDNLIVLNSGETGSEVSLGQSGIEVDRGTGIPYRFMFMEDLGTAEEVFAVGVSGSMQPVATRENAPITNALAYWDSSALRFSTDANYTLDSIATDAELQAVSGALQFQIDNLSGDFVGLTDTPLTYSGSDTYVLTVSGNGIVFTPQSEIIPVLTYPSLSGALDPHYVNVTGDTMTGSLTITGADLVLPDLITTELNVLQLDTNGSVISLELEESFVQVDDIENSDYIGTKGQWSFGNGFYYRCIADDTWVKYEVITDVTTDVTTLTELVVTGDITITSLIPAEDNFLTPDATGKLVDSGFGVVSIAGITNGITQLDATYVNVTGDVMTGTLTISGSGVELHLPDLKTDDENVAQVDLFGNVITTELQELYVPVEDITGPNATGIKGQWSYGLGYKYECIATNTWIKYSVITSW